jgi:uncharacterized protein (TIGR02265 family)
MPADRVDLARRLEAATAADTSRGLNYNTLFAFVAERLGPGVVRQVDVLGRGSRVDFFSYPVAEYLQTAWNAVDRLEVALGGAESVFEAIGQRTVTSFLDTMVGRTVFALAGRDPRRIISQGPSGYRSAVGYGHRSVEWMGPRKGRMIFTRDFMPVAFHRGAILAALQASEAKTPRVEGRETGFLDSVYEFEWT